VKQTGVNQGPGVLVCNTSKNSSC